MTTMGSMHGSMFTSSDLATLISAYPPKAPARNQPSLVRSRSGNSLIKSETVLTRFQNLLDTEPGRLRDLSSRLGIKDASWVIDCYDGPIYFSQNKQDIVTKSELDIIWKAVQSKCKLGFARIAQFASDFNISVDALNSLMLDQGDLQTFLDSSTGAVFVGSDEIVTSTTRGLENAMYEEGLENVNLSARFPSIPTTVLLALASRIKQGGDDTGIEIEITGDEIFSVSSTFRAEQETKQKLAFERNVLNLTHQLENDGFCIVSSGSSDFGPLVEAIDASFRDRNGHVDIGTRTVVTKESSWTLVREDALQTALEKLQEDVNSVIAEQPLTDRSSLNAALNTALIERSSESGLVSIVLNSKLRSTVDAQIATALDSRDSSDFARSFQFSVMAPTHLYIAGLAEDFPLRQHQEELIGGYIRSDIIPHFAEIQRQRTMTDDKARERDIEKLVQACKDGKTLTDMQTPVIKFAKKRTIEVPTTSQLEQVKKETLQQKVQGLHKMSRGSDVLQNLIWIALAQKSEGLFMSAGKDTGRMIKQYQLVGDAAIGERLEQWRNLLKSGEESREDIQDMREMAMRIVDEMYA